jgi:hypothetical protein
MATRYNYDRPKAEKRTRHDRADRLHVNNDMQGAEEQIRHILGRVHVGTSYLGAVRAAFGISNWAAIRAACDTWAAEAGVSCRAYRRQFFRIVLTIHARNRAEYSAVMYPRR